MADPDGFDELAARATELAKDALYVSIGFSLLTFQRTMVKVRELQAAVDGYRKTRPQP